MTAAKQYAFGSGSLFGTRTDIANQTPVQFGAVQDVSLDFSFDNKELYGQYQFPLAVARGKGKVTGKCKTGQFNASAYNSMFYGQTLTTGQELVALNESAAIPSTPFAITPAHAATFLADLGVIGVVSGLPLTEVSSSPATGQYSFVQGTGVYTFAAADTGLSMFISYKYSATTGSKMVISNVLMGAGPVFSIVFNEIYNGNAFTVTLNQCTSTKLSFAFKNDDFNMSDFDFSAFADASGNIGTVSMTNA